MLYKPCSTKGYFNIQMLSYQYSESHYKIGQPDNHLIFTLEAPIPRKTVFILKQGQFDFDLFLLTW